ncbi:TRAFAC clade GTPase domain-containing protein [Micromonospora parva]|uniref:TRAFAC clade GTPase domain-containing protein n=1 Tax=Micromonospora parva TaxID=1464048 RepID=UPI0033CED9C5
MLGRRPPRPVLLDENGNQRPFVPTDRRDRMLTRAEEMTAFQVCEGDGAESPHHLPLHYAQYGTPLVIGVIGSGATGKTTLLAAMIGSLLAASQTNRLPLQVDALDLRLHTSFRARYVNRLLVQREVLPVTRGETVELADALRVRSPVTGRDHAVVFFDMAGEQWEDAERANRFISALNALIFVVDGEQLSRRRGQRGAQTAGDQAFEVVLNRLGKVHDYTPQGFLPLPSALVVAKSDLLRFYGDPELDRWFSYGDAEEFDLSTVEEESLDVYRMLYQRGQGYLRGAERFLRSSLHFASATNTSPDGNRTYAAEGFGPRRTLKPLLSLFQMAGVLVPPSVHPGQEHR